MLILENVGKRIEMPGGGGLKRSRPRLVCSTMEKAEKQEEQE